MASARNGRLRCNDYEAESCKITTMPYHRALPLITLASAASLFGADDDASHQ